MYSLPMRWLLLLCLLSASLLADTGTYGDFSYTSDGVSITITEYKGAEIDVTIPDLVDGLPVRRVTQRVFWNTRAVRSIVFPDSVTQIDFALCADLRSLTSVRLPSGLLRIPDLMFEDCYKLGSVSLPDHLTDIGAAAFNGTGLIKTPDWPSTLTSIGDRAFANCGSLTEVSIPTSVTTLGDGVFSYCTSLKSLSMPATITIWPAQLVRGAISLVHVDVPEGVTALGAGIFAETGLTEISLPSTLSAIPDEFAHFCTELTHVNIPSGVKKIGVNAFKGCSFSSIELPSGLESIGDGALCCNCALSSLTIPEAIAELPEGFLADCTGLRSVTLPGGLRVIRRAAFSYCNQLSAINLPSGLVEIEAGAFGDCASLQEITIPAGIITLNRGVLANCKSLAKVVLPTGLTSIGDRCFDSCASLIKIDLPVGITTLGEGAFANCVALSSIQIPEGVRELKGTFASCHALKEIKLPSMLSAIGSTTFADCTKLESLILPASVKQLSLEAFDVSPALRYVRFLGDAPAVTGGIYRMPTGFSFLIAYGSTGFTTPTWQGYPCTVMAGDFGVTDYSGAIRIVRYEGSGGVLSIPSSLAGKTVRSIASAAFAGNASISAVTLPSTLTDVGNQAFKDCSALRTATFLGDAPTTFGIEVFAGTSQQFQIQYQMGAGGFSSPQWNGYPTGVSGYDFADTGNAITLRGIPPASGSASVPSTINGKPVTVLASTVFAGNTLITSVNLPASLNLIEEGAFAGCSSLESIVVENGGCSFASVGGVLFDSSITRLMVYPEGRRAGDYVVPSGTLQICPKAFAANLWISSVTLPSSLGYVGDSAFNGCPSLVRATFLGSAPEYFGSGVFEGTAKSFGIWFSADSKGFSEPTWKGYPTTAIVFGFKEDSGKLSIVSYLGEGGAVTIPSSFNGKPVTAIASRAFAGCSGVTSLNIAASILSISADAFEGCTQLAAFTVEPGNPAFAARDGVLYNLPLTELLRFPPAALGNFTVPAGVHSIGAGAFSGCNLVTALQLPSSLVSIGSSAFAGCSSLCQVNFAGDAPVMDPSAFTGTAKALTVYFLSGASGFDSAPTGGSIALPLYPNKVSNISTRSYVGTEDKIQIAGFVISGAQPKRVLIRASGPALGAFGVSDVLQDPELKLFDSAQTSIAENNDWDYDSVQAVASSLGAFPWPKGSKDAALLATLAPGSYTAQVSGRAGTTGVVLVEVYDADANPQSNKLTNISTRSLTKTGDKQQIAGFVISGSAPKKVLVRASGPALAAFGLSGTMADPVLSVVDANQGIIASNDDWDSSAIETLAQSVGAFGWTKGSKDAALSLTLQPGSYTAMVAGKNDCEGVTLIEVYELP